MKLDQRTRVTPEPHGRLTDTERMALSLYRVSQYRHPLADSIPTWVPWVAAVVAFAVGLLLGTVGAAT